MRMSSGNEARREGARRANGEFGAWQAQDNADVQLAPQTDGERNAAALVASVGDSSWDRQAVGGDFSDAVIVNEDGTGVDLYGLLADGASFSRSQMEGADFGNAELWRASFIRTNLTGGSFDGANADGASFALSAAARMSAREAYMPRSDFSGAQLIEADFTGADLRGAEFCGADLRGAGFADANINGADFTGALIDPTTNFTGARGQTVGLLVGLRARHMVDPEHTQTHTSQTGYDAWGHERAVAQMVDEDGALFAYAETDEEDTWSAYVDGANGQAASFRWCGSLEPGQAPAFARVIADAASNSADVEVVDYEEWAGLNDLDAESLEGTPARRAYEERRRLLADMSRVFGHERWREYMETVC